tara:strand:- start:8579 stop:9070 length:492 start_codon:yes stop_codon:yes gene_type:complete
MKFKMIKISLITVLFCTCWPIIAQQSSDTTEIHQLLEDYKESINRADTTLAKTFWFTDPEVSFIHPKGHEKGWEEVKKGIYGMFGNRFSKRDLKSHTESITMYGDMAILEFYWVFDATFSGPDPDQMQSKGRETQVLKKIDGTWRIVHVHYSGMPKTGEREGF